MKWRVVVAAMTMAACWACSVAFAAEIKIDSALIRQSVLDYAEGVYSGDVARLERAILPDISRSCPRKLPRTDRFALTYTTHSQLIENARAKVGTLPDSARHLVVSIINIDSIVANVKVTSTSFNDYLQLVKMDGQWRILNIIWNGGPAAANYAGFTADSERVPVEQAALAYMDGQFGADAAKLEMALDQDFSKVTIAAVGQDGRRAPTRQKYETMVENALARVGKVDEIYRVNSATMLDAMNGLAIVRLETIVSREYVQLFKKGEQWKALNTVVVPKTLTLQDAMTVTIGAPMPNFTLPVYGGGEFTLSEHRGKTVLLMFPRGWLGTVWCPYCPYQYLELEELEKAEGIRQSLNLDIAFVMPYSSDRIKDWMEKFPDALTTVEGVKNPQPPAAAGSLQDKYAGWAKSNFPMTFSVTKDSPHTLIPVLVDEQRTFSRMLKIFTGFWDGVTSEQNIATVLIIDKDGILQFKYVGQMTEDRPTVEFLLKLVKAMK